MKRSLLLIAMVAVALAPHFFADADTLPLDKMKALYVRPSAPPFPRNNPYSAEKAKLGQMLFFDPRISGANYIACASCHNPGLAWGDGLPRGIGHGMTVLRRRDSTILNVAWADLLMWDGRKATLEEQALGPMSTPAEMNADIAHLTTKLATIPGYRGEFATAFPAEGLTIDNVAKAIATYERTVVSGTAPFDRWIAGDEKAIGESAKRGFVVFNEKGNCAACHSGWNFTDNSFRDIGLPDADRGRAEIVPLPSMEHAFKTPTLRDISRRGPYMHDGSLLTLEAVVEHYSNGGVERPSRSSEAAPRHLTAQEKSDLVDFMLTLNGDNPTVSLPVLFAGERTAQQ